MNILFLCGCLEPGRDGVGDYTRRLAGELKRWGNEVSIVALNDKSVFSRVEEKQKDLDTLISVLRLPSCADKEMRFAEAKKWADQYRPDWLSLQFVPYSFHDKGIAFGLGNYLKIIAPNARKHIMFHEIWIGFSRYHPIKSKIIGKIQKFIINDLIKKFSISHLTTSNQLYEIPLSKFYNDIRISPIFSNILYTTKEKKWQVEEFEKIGIKQNEKSEWLISGIFGGMHPDCSIIPQLESLITVAKTENKKLAVIAIGRTGNEWHNTLKKLGRTNIKFHHFGEQSPEKISALLQELDWGIVCVPDEYWNKSGSIAALISHNVTLLPWGPKNIPDYTFRLKNNGRVIVNSSVSTTAKFYEDLFNESI